MFDWALAWAHSRMASFLKCLILSLSSLCRSIHGRSKRSPRHTTISPQTTRPSCNSNRRLTRNRPSHLTPPRLTRCQTHHQLHLQLNSSQSPHNSNQLIHLFLISTRHRSPSRHLRPAPSHPPLRHRRVMFQLADPHPSQLSWRSRLLLLFSTQHQLR